MASLDLKKPVSQPNPIITVPTKNVSEFYNQNRSGCQCTVRVHDAAVLLPFLTFQGIPLLLCPPWDAQV